MTLKEFARKGGYARAAKLTEQERINIARRAGLASAKQRASTQDSGRSEPNGEKKSK